MLSARKRKNFPDCRIEVLFLNRSRLTYRHSENLGRVVGVLDGNKINYFGSLFSANLANDHNFGVQFDVLAFALTVQRQHGRHDIHKVGQLLFNQFSVKYFPVRRLKMNEHLLGQLFRLRFIGKCDVQCGEFINGHCA